MIDNNNLFLYNFFEVIMKVLSSNKNVKYFCGSFTTLSSFWHAENVLLDESKLFYITEGEIVIRTEFGETVCKKGDVVLIPAGVKHDYLLKDGGNAKKHWFHFSLTANGTSVFDDYIIPIRTPFNDKKIEDLFKKVNAPICNEYDALMQPSYILEICAILINKSAKPKTQTDTTDIEKVIKYIHDNISSDIRLETLSNLVNLSQNYFVRKFNKEIGMPPMKYLLTIRVETAKSLILNTNYTISQVMQKVGIYDSAYFSKLIKNATGYSPRVLKKMLQIK